MVPLASIVMSDLKAGKGEHYDFDDNGDVEDKSVDDRIICLPPSGRDRAAAGRDRDREREGEATNPVQDQGLGVEIDRAQGQAHPLGLHQDQNGQGQGPAKKGKPKLRKCGSCLKRKREF